MMWRPGGARDQPWVVGLVNNMAPGAMAATERRFLTLLRAALPEQPMRLRRLTCLPFAREAADRKSPLGGYHDITSLREAPVSALIVSGAAPTAHRLQDEPVWPGLTWLADWAAANAVPVIWSCLAAHAAALHLDGLDRVRLRRKLSGIFTCRITGQHPLTVGLPARMPVPHSRYHDIPEAALLSKGYSVVSRSDAVGADAFQHDGAPFLFLQGHPEYEADTLLREYRRDVRRYMAGSSEEYPFLPYNYFDTATSACLADLKQAALARPPGHDMLAELSRVLEAAVISPAWCHPAAQLLANWLDHGAGEPVAGMAHNGLPSRFAAAAGARE